MFKAYDSWTFRVSKGKPCWGQGLTVYLREDMAVLPAVRPVLHGPLRGGHQADGGNLPGGEIFPGCALIGHFPTLLLSHWS